MLRQGRARSDHVVRGDSLPSEEREALAR